MKTDFLQIKTSVGTTLLNHARDLERQLAEAREALHNCQSENRTLSASLDDVREQRDRLAKILSETIGGYDVVSETASICAVYVATVIEPALAAVKGGTQ